VFFKLKFRRTQFLNITHPCSNSKLQTMSSTPRTTARPSVTQALFKG
jgi:hypothetical protein